MGIESANFIKHVFKNIDFADVEARAIVRLYPHILSKKKRLRKKLTKNLVKHFGYKNQNFGKLYGVSVKSFSSIKTGRF